ncbi:hypothetical protein ABZP36_027536 [Zizania latifolia]
MAPSTFVLPQPQNTRPPDKRHTTAGKHRVKMGSVRRLLVVAVVLLLSAAPAARAQGGTSNHDEEEFSYVPGAENGPENWGKNPKWANCITGKMHLGYLNYSYRPAQASIINSGHDIMPSCFDADAGSLVINGTAYHLKQLHWHSPSEHTVDGHRYDLELHLVHQDDQNVYAVIGILYQIGSPDAFLRTLEPYIKKISGRKNMSEQIGAVDPRVVVEGQVTIYYRYMGSLTTPPCTDRVVWTIIKRVHTVAKYQVDLLREALTDGNENNERPLQKRNNRDISIFIPNHPKQD